MMASLYPEPLGVEETLELVGIREIADRRTPKLSGGQAQRVRFSLALASDPELLVLDEPTVGMDVESRRDFWASMRAFAARGKTVIFRHAVPRGGRRVRRSRGADGGDTVILSCSDSDAAVRALLDTHPDARDIEIAGAGLEDAFIELTGRA
jgi:ABC-2 type transport system ATP-binding protein